MLLRYKILVPINIPGQIKLDVKWMPSAGEVSLVAMIFPAALYFWQIPHFVTLAYLCHKDCRWRVYKFMDNSRHSAFPMVALRKCLYLRPLGYLAYDSE
ncbi:unnamed protein product [Coffea canephora]|uniref:Heme O synthase n=1 Tax=Coffea canephora TaxID=49390 RepID=A0A068ULL8_COFCA|nr:unnamed protein product [Coffea canephora]